MLLKKNLFEKCFKRINIEIDKQMANMLNLTIKIPQNYFLRINSELKKIKIITR